MLERNSNTTAKIIFPQNGNSLPDEEKRQEIIRTLHGITHDQIEAIGQALSEQEQRSTEQKKAEQKKTEQIKELYGDKEKILKNLKENYVKVEEDVEMMGYKGKNVHINLPAVGEFKGFKFDYFISDKDVYRKDFENNLKLEKKSYSMKEIGELLKAMNSYMKAMGVETDGDMNYENDLRFWKHRNILSHNAGNFLRYIAGLNNGDLWLKDKIKGSRVRLDCFDSLFYFYSSNGDYATANLFLRLS